MHNAQYRLKRNAKIFQKKSIKPLVIKELANINTKPRKIFC